MGNVALILVFLASTFLAWFGRMTIYCAFSQREESNGWLMLGLGLLGVACTLIIGSSRP